MTIFVFFGRHYFCVVPTSFLPAAFCVGFPGVWPDWTSERCDVVRDPTSHTSSCVITCLTRPIWQYETLHTSILDLTCETCMPRERMCNLGGARYLCAPTHIAHLLSMHASLVRRLISGKRGENEKTGTGASVGRSDSFGVATISSLLRIIGLLCRI